MTILTHLLAYLAGFATLPILLYLIVWWDERHDDHGAHEGDLG